jgi:transcriptional regulator with XRE-family HTH domain
VNRLRKIREDSGRSVTGLSRITGVSRQTIHDLERGQRTGSLETWLKLAAALDTPLEELSGEVYEPLTQYEGKAEALSGSPSPETTGPGLTDLDLEEERRAAELGRVEEIIEEMKEVSAYLEWLASPGKYKVDLHDAFMWRASDTWARLNMRLSELRSLGVEPLAGPLGDKFAEAERRVARAQQAADNVAREVLPPDQLEQRRKRARAERESVLERRRAETA